MGTDGDLRKLKLSKAKTLLRNFGVPEDEVCPLSFCSLVELLTIDCLSRSASCQDGRWLTE